VPAIIKAIDFSRTGQSYGLYCLLCNDDGECTSVLSFDGVGVGHTRDEISAVAELRNLEPDGRWSGFERTYRITSIKFVRDSYDTHKRHIETFGATVAAARHVTSPYALLSREDIAWHLGRALAEQGQQRPESIEETEGNSYNITTEWGTRIKAIVQPNVDSSAAAIGVPLLTVDIRTIR
jgi:hypothetical protein